LAALPSEARPWFTLNGTDEIHSQQGCYEGEKNLLHPAGNKRQLRILILLGCYAAQIGSYTPTFWDNILVPSSRVMQSKN
jgi:hypothetical protein